MNAKTHVIAGLVTAEAVCILSTARIEPWDAAVVIGSSVIGALLPDIDHPHSTISNMGAATKVLSEGINKVSVHRGFCHTLLFALLVAIGCWALYQYNIDHSIYFAVGTIAGVLSHLVLDTLNPTGIMWLYPVSKKHINIMSIRTNSKGETAVRMLLYLAAISGIIVLITKKYL